MRPPKAIVDAMRAELTDLVRQDRLGIRDAHDLQEQLTERLPELVRAVRRGDRVALDVVVPARTHRLRFLEFAQPHGSK